MPSADDSGYGLLITSRPNWATLADRGEWVFKHERTGQRASNANGAVVYLTAEVNRYEPALAGIVDFDGDLEEVPPGKDNLLYGDYPYRVPITIRVRLEDPLDFRQIKDRMSFLPESYWGTVLAGESFLEIPEKDFLELRDFIQSAPHE